MYTKHLVVDIPLVARRGNTIHTYTHQNHSLSTCAHIIQNLNYIIHTLPVWCYIVSNTHIMSHKLNLHNSDNGTLPLPMLGVGEGGGGVWMFSPHPLVHGVGLSVMSHRVHWHHTTYACQKYIHVQQIMIIIIIMLMIKGFPVQHNVNRNILC